uniref:Uncharacterized protein n=1 Tax=Arundo donax TaxID=35708 RepID=A0A0A9HIZ0_ARUDO
MTLSTYDALFVKKLLFQLYVAFCLEEKATL